MHAAETSTLQNIHQVAIREFLEKGFQGASLRNIVKEAGVTTGAFYGYYKSKEELFDALVKEHADYAMHLFCQAQSDFKELPQEQQVLRMDDFGGVCMQQMLEYAYDHLDAFRLILCAADGTKYENFIHEMVEGEIAGTYTFLEVLRQLGYAVKPLNPHLEHFITSGMFSAFFELIIHRVPKDEAMLCAEELHAFYTAGWRKIMGL